MKLWTPRLWRATNLHRVLAPEVELTMSVADGTEECPLLVERLPILRIQHRSHRVQRLNLSIQRSRVDHPERVK